MICYMCRGGEADRFQRLGWPQEDKEFREGGTMISPISISCSSSNDGGDKMKQAADVGTEGRKEKEKRIRRGEDVEKKAARLSGDRQRLKALQDAWETNVGGLDIECRVEAQPD
jgi:hypothetical protein